MLLNNQNLTEIELTKKLNLIQNKINLVSEQNKILVNIYDDEIYDKIMNIFDHINESHIDNTYGNNYSLTTVHNDIVIYIEDDRDYNYSYLFFKYDKTNVNNVNLKLLYDIFKFLIK